MSVENGSKISDRIHLYFNAFYTPLLKSPHIKMEIISKYRNSIHFKTSQYISLSYFLKNLLRSIQ